MQILNNSLLNILIPNDNKALKEVLQQADSKTIEQMINNKSVNINDVLKNLFDDLKSGNKTNSNLENILKNTNIFKELGSVTSNLSTLLNELENSSENPSLQKLKSQLETLFKNIKDLDATNLKEQISKSGVFLESKLSNNSEQTNPTLNKVLNEIQNLLKNTNSQTTQQINENISKILNSTNIDEQTQNLKTLLNNLQNLTNNLSTKDLNSLSKLTQQLQNIVDEGNLVQSKIQNNLLNQNALDSINNQSKELLTQLKTLFTQNPTMATKEILTQLDNLLKLNTFSPNLTNLLTNLKENIANLEPNTNSLNFQNNILKTIEKLETLIKDMVSNPQLLKSNNDVNSDMKSILLQLSDELSSKTDIKSQDILKQVDRLLTNIDYHQLNSLVSNSNSVYVPFFWEMLDEGSINFKASNEEKFYCQINLNLKDFGKVDLMLSLYDKNKLDLTIQAQREHFKVSIQENLQKLKQALNSVNLIPMNIRLLDMKENEEIAKQKENVYLNNNENITLGLDIRA